MYEKVLFIFIMSIICISCKSTKILPDNGTGIEQYRELQSEIRDGETDIVITSERISNDSTDIKQTSSEIRESSDQLGEQLTELEQSIRESETDEQEIGEILQRIRNREITENQLIELGIEFVEIEDSKK